MPSAFEARQYFSNYMFDLEIASCYMAALNGIGLTFSSSRRHQKQKARAQEYLLAVPKI